MKKCNPAIKRKISRSGDHNSNKNNRKKTKKKPRKLVFYSKSYS